MLREMECNVVRTSHNMPAEALVELCDEMGLMLMIEPFDEWEVAKCRNGYLRYFAEWAERDLVNMVHHFRNTLSVVMWSVGDEVPTQSTAAGYRTASWLQSICHREDPTRPVTCGMDQVDDDFAAGEDLPWLIGQFVWTGFDYLGELPPPYHTDAWPNHSSMSGIIDLTSLPKDRYWLYRSVWNRESPTQHILLHWTWPNARARCVSWPAMPRGGRRPNGACVRPVRRGPCNCRSTG